MKAAAADEPGAWEALVDRFAGVIWAVTRGYGLCAADAADVSQTTWLRLAEHIGAIENPDRIAGWLATTARNESLALLRSARRQIPIDPSWPMATPQASDEDPGALRHEKDTRLWKAFDGLPSPCKLLLRMLLAEPPATYVEVSMVLEMPIGSIGPRRSRCLSRLRSKAGLATANVSLGQPA